MAKNAYHWETRAVLQEHSKKKHKILEEYFRAYIWERCKNPTHPGFNLAIVDGFAGGGIYKGGSAGSPVILANTLLNTVAEINLERSVKGYRNVEVKCHMILNDIDVEAIRSLKECMAPCKAKSMEPGSFVNLTIEFHTSDFESEVKNFINTIKNMGFRNVMYYLDQYGHSRVNVPTISNLLGSAKSVEVFLTYAIEALLTYLQTDNTDALVRGLRHLDIKESDILTNGECITKWETLGKMECLVYDTFSNVAPYFSPFAIHNPDGWKYWLMHFCKSPHGRKVYNRVLHENSHMQAHYGRSGLNMLVHNPNDDQSLFEILFDRTARDLSVDQLRDDVVKNVYNHKGEVMMKVFTSEAYRQTIAHSDDIDKVIFESPELEVFTCNGGARRTQNNFEPTDIIKMKPMAKYFIPNLIKRGTKK